MNRFQLISLSAIFLIASMNFSLSASAADSPGEASSANEQKNEDAKLHKIDVKPLSKDELEKLLSTRFTGAIGNTFGQFSNVFFVSSAINLGTSIGLLSDDATIVKTKLEPAFPKSYEPTVKEFLDAIALETGSKWRYDEEDQFILGEKASDQKAENIVNFKFVKDGDDKNPRIEYTIDPAEGWKMKPQTNWIMYVPPNHPFGMDLHVLGKLTTNEASNEKELLSSAAKEFALDLYKTVEPEATATDIKQTKVGEYEAYFFEHQLPPKGKEQYRWRQWHFIVGNRLLYIISTLPIDQDETLYPDVEKMVKSFRKTGEEKSSGEQSAKVQRN